MEGGGSLPLVDTPPPGYKPPILVYLVEETDQTGEKLFGQIGGFFTEEEAATLLKRLTDEGRYAHINMVAIHQRAVDYEYDR
jgi:hypothetical protein